MNWETVLGLEVHVRLKTASKLFCDCPSRFGDPANTNVCAVCMGLPGALPVTNRNAVDLAARVALALGCEVHKESVFARKSYFYPDLPKGYQITQYENPIATGGELEAPSEAGAVCFVLNRIHIEEDAGKSIHDRVAGSTLVDLNRAGVPLVEIVTEPTVADPADARSCLVELKRVLEYLGVSDCNMEDGSLRVDANISVRRPGEQLGNKQEVKNLNSFAAVEWSLEALREEQISELESGGTVSQLTFSASDGTVKAMRDKEGSDDYRYFPEPDLPPVVLSEAKIKSLSAGLLELPAARRFRFSEEYGLSTYDARVLTATREVADFFEDVVRLSDRPGKLAGGWIMNEVLAVWSGPGPPLSAVALGEIISLVEERSLSRRGGKKVVEEMAGSSREEPPRVVAENLGLILESDVALTTRWVEDVIREHPAEMERLRDGEARLMDFLVGRVMRTSAATSR